jgi:hypothetical protein
MGAVVECLKRYLLAQQVVLPGMVITIITSCLCPLYNWLLIFKCVPVWIDSSIAASEEQPYESSTW